MDIIKRIRSRAAQLDGHLLLPESGDPRVLEAARFLSEERLCRKVTLVGKEDEIRNRAESNDIELPEEIESIDFENWHDRRQLIEYLYNRRKHKGLTKEGAEELLSHPLFFAACLTGRGYADGCVGGSLATTRDVVRAALQCIGTREGTSIISSIFLMAMPDGRVFTYGDCGVVPYPDKYELADIALESAKTHSLLTGEKPMVAMLSFSTKGSAEHEKQALVLEALEIARKKSPGLLIDGELQFDAAYMPEVAKRKAPGSEVAGRANVYIFPNLDAGNIGYKITERVGGASATGPILQGLRKPMMDLSRGCDWEDIVNAGCVALLMGE